MTLLHLISLNPGTDNSDEKVLSETLTRGAELFPGTLRINGTSYGESVWFCWGGGLWFSSSFLEAYPASCWVWTDAYYSSCPWYTFHRRNLTVPRWDSVVTKDIFKIHEKGNSKSPIHTVMEMFVSDGSIIVGCGGCEPQPKLQWQLGTTISVVGRWTGLPWYITTIQRVTWSDGKVLERSTPILSLQAWKGRCIRSKEMKFAVDGTCLCR